MEHAEVPALRALPHPEAGVNPDEASVKTLGESFQKKLKNLKEVS